MSENTNENQPVERTEDRKTEEVVQAPTADEGGPLGNITNAVTNNEPVDTVVKKTEEHVEEKPAEQPENASDH